MAGTIDAWTTELDARASYAVAERISYLAGKVWKLTTDLARAGVSPFVASDWVSDTIARKERASKAILALVARLNDWQVSIGGES